MCSDLKIHLRAEGETVDHFLLECPLYARERDELFEEIETQQTLNSNCLLSGSDELDFKENEQIFLAVQKFILKTQRFE